MRKEMFFFDKKRNVKRMLTTTSHIEEKKTQ